MPLGAFPEVDVITNMERAIHEACDVIANVDPNYPTVEELEAAMGTVEVILRRAVGR